MALYEPQSASLNDIKGSGFIFARKTYAGKEYQGVFFSDDDGDLEKTAGQDEVLFTGVVYERSKTKYETVPVEIRNIENVHLGHRADFTVIDE